MTPPDSSPSTTVAWRGTIYVCDECGDARLYNQGKAYRSTVGVPVCCGHDEQVPMREIEVEERSA